MNILVIDDHELTAAGIASALKKEYADDNILTANNGFDALDVIKGEQIDLLFTDISMPGMTGIELIEKAREISSDLKIIVVTFLENYKILQQIGKMKVDSVVLKTDRLTTFIKAVKEVKNGDRYISAELIAIFAEQRVQDSQQLGPELSDRELDVLELAANDHSNTQIADKLHISVSTIDTHRRNIRNKMQVGNMTAAVAKAYRFGWLPREKDVRVL